MNNWIQLQHVLDFILYFESQFDRYNNYIIGGIQILRHHFLLIFRPTPRVRHHFVIIWYPLPLCTYEVNILEIIDWIFEFCLHFDPNRSKVKSSHSCFLVFSKRKCNDFVLDRCESKCKQNSKIQSYTVEKFWEILRKFLVLFASSKS